MVSSEELFGALLDWNMWGNLQMGLKEREIMPALPPKDIILSVMGVRRSGKTRLCYLISKNFNPDDILIINFEDPRLRGVNYPALTDGAS